VVVSSCLKLLSVVRKLRGKSDLSGEDAFFHDKYLLAGIFSMLPVSISRILGVFGSDKNLPGQHSYGATYQNLFQPMRYKPVKLLEIGLLYGNSLLTWRWFFPFATIIGIDIEPKIRITGNKIKIYTGSQYSEEFLQEICQKEGYFDIVIDDGSHMNKHQIFSFEKIFDSLKDGGIYVIEDVQTSFWEGEVRGENWDGKKFNDPEFFKTCYGYFLELSKYLNYAEFPELDGADQHKISLARKIKRISFEHNMIIISKGKNEEKSNWIDTQIVHI